MKKKSLIIAVVAFVVLCAAAVAIYFATLPKPEDGKKTVTIEVVYPDSTSKEFTVKTDGEFLSDALVEANLVKAEEVEFFSTVDGVIADYSKDGAWWCITKNKEMCNYGAKQLPIADGDHYEITYTIGFSE